MANFFSLGSCSNNNNNNPPPPPPPIRSQFESQNSGVLLYRNEEIYQKGFEIWQQYVQVHHPKTDPHRPFLMNHHVAQSSGRSSSGVGGMNCQDCGNQAKKDCSHLRCRSCCKSRGFDCPTHVKSTWVPAAQRRERQQRLSRHSQPEIKGEGSHHRHHMRLKRQREEEEEEEAIGLELGQQFPAEVNAPAIFRCVRVQSSDDTSDQQLAYQTTVNINGRLFKGILYDQGPERRYPATTTPTPTRGGVEENLISATAVNQESATCFDPNNNNNNNSNDGLYPPQISAFLAGTQFFPPSRS